ncbi:hypothetical protein [Lactococcus lactis]|uniref:hypothetical protein n=1 Tax=Lactococcus lactis TaxID=1358 RepID=UPI00145608BC|nr:hypothetical protein [Lactococcus lactis]MCT0437865.1 hypothetical protein [Lactococcus lactis subsp. lactis]MCT2920788.1 hypothetical protein [Lactococcus lactis]NLS47890.1 hypothetical protein [Lactococcus lactis]GFO79904.1 hypothetical protein LL1119B1_19600 [Lactococcus lactis]
MKITDLQKLDQNIIKFLSEHRGIDQAIKGRILAQALNIDFRTLQGRIEYLHKQGCAIGSIDNGYFIPTNEEERRAGIIKKQRTGIAINNAVNGYTLVELDWIDKMLD